MRNKLIFGVALERKSEGYREGGTETDNLTGVGFNAGNSRVGKFPGILVFPGNRIPGNKVRESRDFCMCVFYRKMTGFFSSWSPEKSLFRSLE